MTSLRRFARLASCAFAAALVAAPTWTGAQAPGPRVVTPQFDFSGVMYPQFRYAYDDATRDANGGRAARKFDLERAYLNFRMPAGDDGSVRVTADVYQGDQSASSYYKGWALRLKYAYFQYQFLHDIGGHDGFNALARFGMVPTALVDYEEGFWPRWISQVAVERAGFFSSSDLGAAGVVTLPRSWGEVYAVAANGPGYGSGEADPYTDYSVRVSLTPFGRRTGLLRTATVSPWIYAGKTASRFLGTAGSAGSGAADGLTRNRAGVFVGLRDRRLTAGFDWARRTETAETGTSLATRGAYDNTGTVSGAFVLARPGELFAADSTTRSRYGVLARLDRIRPFSDQRAAGPATGTQTTSSSTRLLIAGVFWDLNARATLALDVQHLRPEQGSTTTESKILFLHAQVTF